MVVPALGAAGCAAESDAVASFGTFDFVSPSGRTNIFSGPPENRGTVRAMSGPDLTADEKTTALSDFAGKVVVINLRWRAPGPVPGDPHDPQ